MLRIYGFRKTLFNKLGVALVSFFFLSVVIADTQQIVDYEYDTAGNIITVRSGQNLGPPDVTNLSPPFVNKESFAFVTATGVNLAKAEVNLTAPGITLIDVTNISDTQVKFTIFADNTATIGAVPVTFTTRLGNDTENIIVAERTPVVSTDPNPIILTPNAQPVEVLLTFDQPFANDQVYDIAITITDNTIATVSDETITLLAGKTEVSTTVTGLAVGTTTLEINQLSKFIALGIPVVVTDDQLPAGTHLFYSKPVGISIYTGPTSYSGSGVFTTANPVGVSIYTGPTPFSGLGVFTTAYPLGVSTYTGPGTFSGTGVFTSPNALGVAYGTYVTQMTPAFIQQGTSTTLVIKGFELNDVTSIRFDSDDGITQTGAFSVNTEGTQMTVPVSVSSSATTGLRTIFFTTSLGEQQFSEGVFRITN